MDWAGFGVWVVRFRWGILAATIGLVAVAGSGIRFLQFTNDYRVFFSDDNPELQAFEALQNVYSKNDDNVMFVVAPRDGEVFTRGTLDTVERLTRDAWQLPYATRVDSLTNFQHTSASGDDLVVRSLIEDARSRSDAELARAKAIALAEPMLVDVAISPRAHVTGVNVLINLPGRHLEEPSEVTAAARRLVDAARAQNPNVEIHLTGGVVMNNAFGEYSKRDFQTLMPLMYAVVIVVLLISLGRSIAGTVAALLVIGGSVVVALGLAGWLDITLSPPSVAAPTVILTLALANSIHVVLTMFAGLRRGLGKIAAIGDSLRLNIRPVVLTTVTDVIGFLTMNFSEVPPFRDLGNIVALGVVSALFLSLGFLPAFLAVTPLRAAPASRAHTPWLDRLADWVIARRRGLLWAASAVALALVIWIPRNQLNDEWVDYFDTSVDFRRATDFAAANLGGVYAIHYSLASGQSGGINDPAYLQTVAAFAAWYRTQPGVVHVSTITDISKRLNQNLHGDDPAWYRIPDSRELAAQYLLLYELSLPFGLDLNNQINVDKSATRVMVVAGKLTTADTVALDDSAYAWLREHAPTMATRGTGATMMFAYIGARNISSMIKGNIVSLLLISVVILVVLRHVKIGFLSLVPNLAPAALAFGFWGLVNGHVGLSLSVVAAMTYGIVVDDTVHFLDKYLHARRGRGASPEDAVRYAFATVGHAMWATSAILIAGFSVLAFSAFKLNSDMGLMTAITIAFAALADLLLLPPLLMKMEERAHAKTMVVDAPVSVAP